MNNDFFVRAMARSDLGDVASILDDTGLFPSAMLAEMAEPFLGGDSASGWFVAIQSNQAIGFAYCEPERMTEGTYNLLAIAVAIALQRNGTGAMLVRHVESWVESIGGRLLLVETSSDPDQTAARAFYAREGFDEEARIRDFYAPGQTKVIFWKKLQPSEVLTD